jgi:hypothetical protein
MISNPLDNNFKGKNTHAFLVFTSVDYVSTFSRGGELSCFQLGEPAQKGTTKIIPYNYKIQLN